MHHGDDLVEHRTREPSFGAQCTNHSAKVLKFNGEVLAPPNALRCRQKIHARMHLHELWCKNLGFGSDPKASSIVQENCDLVRQYLRT